MSEKCELCGLTQEHERRVCELKDPSTHKMELNVSELTEDVLYWIRDQVEEMQDALPSKWIDLRIKGIAPRLQRASFIPMAHEKFEDLRTHEYPTYPTWVCDNHSPGSEIEVKKGDACCCGRVE